MAIEDLLKSKNISYQVERINDSKYVKTKNARFHIYKKEICVTLKDRFYTIPIDKNTETLLKVIINGLWER